MRKESRLKLAVFLPSALFMLIAGQSLLSGQEKKWPEIAPEELAMTDCPQQPGAAAIYLYREEIEDRSESLTSIFERIKILTPAGGIMATLRSFIGQNMKLWRKFRSGLSLPAVKPVIFRET